MTAAAKKLPPFGRQYLTAVSSAGLCVAIGKTAWDFVKRKPFPVLVLPPTDAPSDYRWPSHPGGAVLFERGSFDDDCLQAMVLELLVAGCPFVVAIREALMDDDPRHFFFPEAKSVSD